MIFQVFISDKFFGTKLTLEVFDALMNNFDVRIEIILSVKAFITLITDKPFDYFMKTCHMMLEITICSIGFWRIDSICAMVRKIRNMRNV